MLNEETFTRELTVYNTRLREFEEQVAQLQDELVQMRAELIHDHDTALYSSAYFHTRLQEEVIRSERYRHFLSMVLIHFEVQNHESTHQFNRELRKIGMELQAGLARRTDILALYRKRQMIIMLPETDTRGAQILIQRYKAMFANHPSRRLSYLCLTYPNDASNLEQVLVRLQEISENLHRGTNIELLCG